MRRIRALPIQLQITLGSLLVAGIVLAGVAALLAYQIRATTGASEVTLARSDIAPYISDLKNDPTEAPDKPPTGVLVAIREETGSFTLNSLPALLQQDLNDRDLHDVHFQRVAESMRNSEAPVRRVTSGGTTYVVVERHLVTSKGDFTLWAARSTAAGDLTVRALDRSLIVGLVVALLAFGVAAWLLSSLTLRPVRRLVRSAEQLSREDNGQQLPVSSAGDELSTLASTLNAFIDRLRASADHERQIVSDASHELRTPIAALLARLELAHRSFGDADALEKDVVAAEKTAARLSDLTTTLLELSRLDQSAHAVPESQWSTAADLGAELLDGVDRARIAPDRGGVDIDFRIDVAGDPTSRYAVTRASFGRIVDNLIGNAVTFSPADGIVLGTLELTADSTLRFTVTDEGPGVPEEFRPLAFDRFSRADESRRRVGGGTGLGLALVKGLATRAGGAVDLRNRPGGGAAATVELPSM